MRGWDRILFPVVPAQVAVMCLLFLRGPLTRGEINSNSGRLYEFENLDDVQEVLEQLSTEELPFIIQLPKRAGKIIKPATANKINDTRKFSACEM